VQVPRGHRVGMETASTGEVAYECRLKSIATGEFDWLPVGSSARLTLRNGREIARYSTPPASWQHNDGSRLTGTLIAVAASTPGQLAYELVRADPATGDGVMNDITYIQRIPVRGGAPPSVPCGGANMGDRQVLPFQADYIFYRGYSAPRE
jgi:hypothetical protein